MLPLEVRTHDSEKRIRIEVLTLGITVNAPVLVDFWSEIFRLQVEARSGQLRLDTEGV